jgi:hypothetical protein
MAARRRSWFRSPNPRLVDTCRSAAASAASRTREHGACLSFREIAWQAASQRARRHVARRSLCGCVRSDRRCSRARILRNACTGATPPLALGATKAAAMAQLIARGKRFVDLGGHSWEAANGAIYVVPVTPSPAIVRTDRGFSSRVGIRPLCGYEPVAFAGPA